MSVKDQTAADTGSERDHDHAFTADSGAAVAFAQCGTVCVVVNINRTGEGRTEYFLKPHLIHAEVGAENHFALRLVDRARDADADGCDILRRDAVLLTHLLCRAADV